MEIRVDASEGNAGTIDWAINGKKPKDSVIDVKKGDPAEDLEFKLDDRTREKLEFNCNRPFDVHENSAGACPPPGIHTSEIELLSCSSKKLVVRDMNKKECTLHYQLNFIDRSGRAHIVDPEIRNGGGGAM